MADGYKYSKLTEQIIGCAMRVHGALKNGHREVVYQRCMIIELEKAGMIFRQEVDMPIFYEGVVVGRRRIDLLVENNIPVELKALATLENEHLAQAINNLETHRFAIGLLINFGAKNLQFRRVINNKIDT
ncbi:GxxExxY protein [Paracnuella aquatica]|uniref:GxxExxY protein n=1 Tax=Paracnuella aquatica TaxID=2268757 RepID=UPI000DEF623C|nr:GxxExxY protein [Paracnuella aquatica]RPD50892.1 GxxExxY protein [Paracnuella aquatica]